MKYFYIVLFLAFQIPCFSQSIQIEATQEKLTSEQDFSQTNEPKNAAQSRKNDKKKTRGGYDFSCPASTCYGTSVSFEINKTEGIDLAFWDFGDPASVPNNTSSQIKGVSHNFSKPGYYTVKLIVFFNDSTETIFHNIRVNRLPQPNMGHRRIYSTKPIRLNPGNFSSYLWDDGSTQQTRYVRQSGSYNVSVKDENGCTKKQTTYVSIQNPTVGFENIENDSPYSCADTIFLKALQPEKAGGYIMPATYGGLAGDEFSGSENTVNLYADDKKADSIILGELPDLVFLNITAWFLNPTTKVTLEWGDTKSSGVFPYVFHDAVNFREIGRGEFNFNNSSETEWRDGIYYLNKSFSSRKGIATFSGKGVTNNGDGTGYFTAAEHGAGTYTIKYCWDNEEGFSGCATQTIRVEAPDANAGEDKYICKGDTTQIGGNTNSEKGKKPFIYRWSPSFGLSDPTVANPIVTTNTTRTYTLSVTDADGAGCTATDQVTVYVHENPQIELPTKLELCQGETQRLEPKINNETPQNSHTWSGDTAYLSNTEIQSPYFHAKKTGQFVYHYHLKDKNNCKTADSIRIEVFPNPKKPNLGNDTFLWKGNSLILDAGISHKYKWNNNAALNTRKLTVKNAGRYFVDVFNEVGCTNSDTIFIADYPQINIGKTHISGISCHDTHDAKILVEATGGIGKLTYVLNDTLTQNEPLFEHLPPGKYTVTVKDENNFTVKTQQYTIEAPEAIKIDDVKLSNLTCYNYRDGKIEIEASGGTGKLRYALNNGNFQESPKFANLDKGKYIVKIIDDNLCNYKTDTFDIFEPSLLKIDSIIHSNLSCYDKNDGSFKVFASGGNGKYSFRMNDKNFVADNTFRDLYPGTYKIRIKDHKGCKSAIDTLVIKNVPAIIIASIQTKPIDCYDSKNGQISIQAVGGTGKLRYQLNNLSENEDGIFNNLDEGNYRIKITDSNNCTSLSDTLQLYNPPKLSIDSLHIVPIQCHDDKGELEIFASGGSGMLHYQMNDSTFVETKKFKAIHEGKHIFAVKDGNNCTISSAPIEFKNPPLLHFDSIAIKHLTCFESGNGEIAVEAKGGTGKLMYQLNDTLSSEENSFAKLQKGNYTIRIQDENRCSIVSDTLKINQPKPIRSSFVLEPITCHNFKDGMIKIDSISGGNGNYRIKLNDSAFQTDSIFNSLPAGIFFVEIRDNLNCSFVSDTIFIHNPPLLQIDSLRKTDITCHGYANGRVEVFASGGSGMLHYQMNDSVFVEAKKFKAIHEGKHVFAVKDSNNCTISSAPIEFKNPPLLHFDSIAIKHLTCFESGNGEIAVEAKGGTGKLMYQLNDTLSSEENSFAKLQKGNYTIRIQDENRCSIVSDTLKINQPKPIRSSFVLEPITCHNFKDGMIKIDSISGGNGNYRIKLNDSAFQTDSIFNSLPAGIFFVEIRDSLNCSFVSDTIFIHNPPLLQIDSLRKTDITCHGYANGRIEVFASGGTGQYNYSINKSEKQAESVFENLKQGENTIAVFDEHLCTLTSDTIVIIEPEKIETRFSKEDVRCYGDTTGEISITSISGKKPYKIKWSTGDTSLQIVHLKAGFYDCEITDSSQCSVLETIEITENEKIELDVITKDASSKNASDGQISFTINGGVPEYLVLWKNTQGKTITNISELKPGFYFVEITDAYNCTVRDSAEVKFDDSKSELSVPNVIFPEGNRAENNSFYAKCTNINTFQLYIFNRWGVKLFSYQSDKVGEKCPPPEKAWNGKIKNREVKEGIYYFMLKAEGRDGKKYEKQGAFYIIR